MAYNKKDLIKKSLKAIEKNRLFFIEDIVCFLPCSKKTFYNHGLHELPELKAELEKKKIEVKVSLRSKWYKSDNPTLQMGLYKLIASEHERKALSMQYMDSKVNHRFDNIDEIDVSDLSSEEKKILFAITESRVNGNNNS